MSDVITERLCSKLRGNPDHIETGIRTIELAQVFDEENPGDGDRFLKHMRDMAKDKTK